MRQDELREVVEHFLERLFKQDSEAHRDFDDLCKAGCDRDELGGWIYAVSHFAAAELHKKSEWDLELEAIGTDMWTVSGLPARIERLATEIKRINRSRNLSPAGAVSRTLEMLPPAGQDYPRKLASCFLALPEFLGSYAAILKKLIARPQKRVGRRSFKFLPFVLRNLLGYVNHCTRQPRCQAASNLLCAGYAAADGASQEPPSMLNVDALKKLWQRSQPKSRTAR